MVFALSAVLAAAPRTRHIVHHDAVTIEVIAEGRGPLVALLPSLGDDSEEFDSVAERIASAGFRVLRPQPRGYGRSTGPMQISPCTILRRSASGMGEVYHARYTQRERVLVGAEQKDGGNGLPAALRLVVPARHGLPRAILARPTLKLLPG
jgi:pimeloyl-ACP methyl ester carboxylesterase